MLIASCKGGGILRLKKSVINAIPHIVGYCMPYIMKSHFIIRLKAHFRASHIVATIKAHLAMMGLLTHYHTQIKVGYKVVRFMQRSTSLPEIRNRLTSADYKRELRAILRRGHSSQVGDLRLTDFQRQVLSRHQRWTWPRFIEYTTQVRLLILRRIRAEAERTSNAVHHVASASAEIAETASSDVASAASRVVSAASTVVRETTSSSGGRGSWIASLWRCLPFCGG